MTTEQQVTLVESDWDEYGLMLALPAVELPKATWYHHRQRQQDYTEQYRHVRPMLEEIARKQPECGYRRLAPLPAQPLRELRHLV